MFCLIDSIDDELADIGELFDTPAKSSIYGCLYVNGKPIIVNSKEELETIIKELA